MNVQVNDWNIEKDKDWFIDGDYLIVNYVITEDAYYLGELSFIDLEYSDAAANHTEGIYSFQLFD